MSNFLQQTIERKYQEVEQQQQRLSFKEHLAKSGLSLITEIKRRSPSAGDMAEITDPLVLAKQYAAGGADAISVLTDKEGFNGELKDLAELAAHKAELQCPLLRKDFVVEPYQIAEAVVAGADAILLMVSVLGARTQAMLNICRQLKIDALVEVHDAAEIDIALCAGADIVGINNRDLSTLQVDINNCLGLRSLLPKDVIAVAESGIKTTADIELVRNAGFDAALIGSSLVQADNSSQLIQKFKQVGAPCHE